MNTTNNTIKLTPLPNVWKKWVATNLVKGVSQQQITQVLKQNGFQDPQIALEFEMTKNNPYLKAAKDLIRESQANGFSGNTEGSSLITQLDRRNWLLATVDELASLDPSYSKEVDRIDTPSFDDFIKKYYSKHLPVVLQNGINHWKALEKWTPKYFAENFGENEVQIQFDRESDADFEINSPKLRKIIKMSEYVSMIESNQSSNNFYMTANNTAKNITAIRAAFEDLGDFGEGYRQLSKDPTLNTFFWMGPKGIYTPMHFDLTNNMLVQIYGKKRVTLIPAFQVPLLYNTKHVFSDVNFQNIDYNKHPLMKDVTPIEVTIEAGEALFIPIGWWHCVDGLEKSISISFTNFNAPNSFFQKYNDIG